MILRFFVFLTLLGALLPAIPSTAQRRLAEDDTLFFALHDAVTVTATGVPTALRDAPAAVDIYAARTIDILPARSLSDLLSLTTGATVRDYGGSGSLQLASLRGLGAEYTLVLLDGMRLNGAQNALVDVGQLSLDAVDRIEIVRGGLASLYGSSALGGVVNIVSARERPPLSAMLGLGAFGWRLGGLAAGTQGRAGRAWADFRYEERRNDFPFTPTWGSEQLRRENAAMFRRTLAAGGTLLLPSAALTARTDLSQLDSGTPGAVFTSSQGQASQRDRHALLSLQLDAQLAPRRQLRVTTGVRAARQEYRDPAYRIGDRDLESRYDQTQFLGSALLEEEFAGGHRLLGGLEAQLEQLASPDLPLRPHRVQAALFASGDIHLRVAGLPLRLYPALRYDMISDDIEAVAGARPEALQQLSPSLGMHFSILPATLGLRARFARAFAAPTFNQLYWREGGNPGLRPEYSTAFDAGIVHTAGEGLLTTELTYFHHDITDKIVWAPSSGLYWTPRNVQHVRSSGIEAQLQLQWDLFSLRAGGQWMSSRKINAAFPGDATAGKQLIYVPEWSGALTFAAAPLDWLQASLTGRLLGQRYYNETNTASLPTHAVADLAVQAELGFSSVQTNWKAELLNMFDAAYEVVAFYPMPGRQLRLTVRTTLR